MDSGKTKLFLFLDSFTSVFTYTLIYKFAAFLIGR